VPHDVDIEVGSDSSAAAAGLAELRGYGAQIHSDLSGIFSRAIAAGGIVAFLDSVVEKAHEIHHESERFNIDAQQLQEIGNAAQVNGIELNQVARAMNLVEIAAYKAAEGDKAASDALERLGINAQEFYQLPTDQKIYAIADALHNATDRGSAYEAVATLIGKRNTELIPILEQGSEALREQASGMGRFSDSAVEQLEKVHREFEQMKNDLTVVIGGALATLVSFFRVNVYALTTLILDFAQLAVASFHTIEKAFHFDWAGIKKEWGDFFAYVKEMDKGFNEYYDEEFNPPSAPRKPAGLAPGSEGSSISADAGADVGGTSRELNKIESIKEQIAKLDDEHAARQRSDYEQLTHLYKVRDDLLKNSAQTNVTDLGTAETNLKLAQNQVEIDKLEGKLSKESTDALAEQEKLRQQQREEAEKEVQEEDQKLRLMQLQNQYGDEAGQKMEDALELDEKIADVTEQIVAANRDNNVELAKTLTHLRDDLEAEKKITAEKAAQAAEQKRIADGEERALQFQELEVREASLVASGLQEQAENITAIFAGAPEGATWEQAVEIWRLKQASAQALRQFQIESVYSYAKQNKGYFLTTPQSFNDQLLNLLNANDFRGLEAMLQQMLDRLNNISANTKSLPGAH
jgi:hypothetical protein